MLILIKYMKLGSIVARESIVARFSFHFRKTSNSICCRQMNESEWFNLILDFAFVPRYSTTLRCNTLWLCFNKSVQRIISIHKMPSTINCICINVSYAKENHVCHSYLNSVFVWRQSSLLLNFQKQCRYTRHRLVGWLCARTV